MTTPLTAAKISKNSGVMIIDFAAGRIVRDMAGKIRVLMTRKLGTSQGAFVRRGTELEECKW